MNGSSKETSTTPVAKTMIEAFAELLAHFGIAAEYVIVCDGSGTNSKSPCGHYAALYSVRTGKVLECHGGASQGTSNYAELAPFVHALWLLENLHPAREDEAKPRRVLCVTDSEITAFGGSGRYARKANLALWASIDWFVPENGYVLVWRHVPRNSNSINKRADKVAGEVRRLFVQSASGTNERNAT